MSPSIGDVWGGRSVTKSIEDQLMEDLQDRISASILSQFTPPNDITNQLGNMNTGGSISHHDINKYHGFVTNGMGVPMSLLGKQVAPLVSTPFKTEPPPNLEIKNDDGDTIFSIDANKKEIYAHPSIDIDETAKQLLSVCQLEVEDLSYAKKVTDLEARVAELEEENLLLEETIIKEILHESDDVAATRYAVHNNDDLTELLRLATKISKL